jgi:hypothetical protein
MNCWSWQAAPFSSPLGGVPVDRKQHDWIETAFLVMASDSEAIQT